MFPNDPKIILIFIKMIFSLTPQIEKEHFHFSSWFSKDYIFYSYFPNIKKKKNPSSYSIIMTNNVCESYK